MHIAEAQRAKTQHPTHDKRFFVYSFLLNRRNIAGILNKIRRTKTFENDDDEIEQQLFRRKNECFLATK